MAIEVMILIEMMMLVMVVIVVIIRSDYVGNKYTILCRKVFDQ